MCILVQVNINIRQCDEAMSVANIFCHLKMCKCNMSLSKFPRTSLKSGLRHECISRAVWYFVSSRMLIYFRLIILSCGGGVSERPRFLRLFQHALRKRKIVYILLSASRITVISHDEIEPFAPTKYINGRQVGRVISSATPMVRSSRNGAIRETR